jgi:uncharacterized membrane protein/protein-disulfide isomerase
MLVIPTRNLILIRILTTVSIVASAYLLVTSLRSGPVAGCGPDSGCQAVLTSRWSHWFGLPVSAPALLLYLTTLLATFRGKASALLPLTAWLLVLAAAWFVTIQIFLVQALCPYCLVTHIAAAGAAILILKNEPRPSRGVAVGVALGAALLLIGQSINRPASHEVVAGAAPRGSAPTAQPTTTGRQLEIFGGMFKINVDEVPLIGAKDAPAVIVSLLDYTCPHCRRMHGVLLDAEKAHRGKLAIAMLPMPLDAACNKVVPRTAPQHANACQYANLALAVWRADASKMDQFNDWLFELPQPPGLESAIGYAQEIVGDEALGRAMNDPWVAKQLAQNIAIYEATYKRFGKGVMPQLVVGDHIVFGELENGMQDLEMLLRDVLR